MVPATGADAPLTPVTPTSAPQGCDPCKLNLGIGLAECIIDQLANKFPLVKALNCLYALSKCGGKIDDKGNKIAFNVKVGDKVLMPKYGGTEVKFDGHEYQIMREEDILGIIG